MRVLLILTLLLVATSAYSMSAAEKIIKGIDSGNTALLKDGVADLSYELSLAYPDAEQGYNPEIEVNALSTSGKYIMRNGSPFSLRGVSLGGVADASKTGGWTGYAGGTLNAVLTPLLNDTDLSNINAVRLPIHGAHYFGTDYIDGALDAHVQAVTNAGKYAIIDWHPIAPHGDIYTYQKAYDFWEYTAQKYKNNPNVIFEIFNEPTTPYTDGLENWLGFRKMYQPLVNMIRSYAPDNLLIIGSPSWSALTDYIDDYPFNCTNCAYTYHSYPNGGSAYDARVGQYLEDKVPDTVPVVVTEWGYSVGNTGAHTELSENIYYADALADFFKRNPHVGWTAWSYDPATIPAMTQTEGASLKAKVKELVDVPTDFNYIPPTPTPTYKLVLDASTGVTINGAGQVTSIDAGGYTLNAIEDGFTVGAINNHDAIVSSFDWNGQSLSFNADTILDGGNQLTIMAVIEPDMNAAQVGTLIHIADGSYNIRIYADSSNDLIGAQVGSKYLTLPHASGIATITLTVNRTTGKATFQVNDTFLNSTEIGIGNFSATGVTGAIASHNSGSTPYTGKIGYLSVQGYIPAYDEINYLKSTLEDKFAE